MITLCRPFSRLVFQWLMPFLNVGYSRPLQNDGASSVVASGFILSVRPDLWEFPKDLQTSRMASELEEKFFQRCPPEQRPPIFHPSSSSPHLGDSAKDVDLESTSGENSGGRRRKKKQPYDSPLVKALHQMFFYRWWFAGILKLLSGASSGPLLAMVNPDLLCFAQTR